MTLSLNTIKSNKSLKQPKKRIGRGNGSGIGTYSGKGLKGQKARAGVSGLKRLGMRQILLRIPKSRGFKSLNGKDQVLNLDDLNVFKDKDIINNKALKEKGLIAKETITVKILGDGELTVKGLTFENIKISESAKEKITKLDGTIL